MPILPENEKKIMRAGMDLGILEHLARFHRASVSMQQGILPLVKPLHSTLDRDVVLDLETISKILFKTTNATPAQKYSTIRILENTLYFTRSNDPYNPIFKPRPEPDIAEILTLCSSSIEPNSDLEKFIKKAQSLVSSFRAG
jgi:hypothetical protein